MITNSDFRLTLVESAHTSESESLNLSEVSIGRHEIGRNSGRFIKRVGKIKQTCIVVDS